MHSIFYLQGKIMFLKTRILFLIGCISALATSCSDSRVRTKPHIPESDTDLVTGCYYITDDTSHVKRFLDQEQRSFYLDPHAIVTVDHFESIRKTMEYGCQIEITLDETGAEALKLATAKSIDKRIGVVVDNYLLMAPVVQGEIAGGRFVISGGFDKNEQERIYNFIDHEMYETPVKSESAPQQ